VTDALGQFAKGRGFMLRRLALAIERRAFTDVTGGEFVPDDPDPPRIGAIELLLT
jgi:hypothetical protein